MPLGINVTKLDDAALRTRDHGMRRFVNRQRFEGMWTARRLCHEDIH